MLYIAMFVPLLSLLLICASPAVAAVMAVVRCTHASSLRQRRRRQERTKGSANPVGAPLINAVNVKLRKTELRPLVRWGDNHEERVGLME